MPDIPAITTEEIKPESFGETAKITVYTNPEKVRIEQRSTEDWSDEALRLLNKLESWSREFGQSNREIFFQKAEWHGALVYGLPDGKLRGTMLDSYVRFLASSPIKNESPPEWAMWLNRLITAAGVTDRRDWIDRIEAAGDPAVAVYCRLARLSMREAQAR